jgi:phage-related tail fiber protein
MKTIDPPTYTPVGLAVAELAKVREAAARLTEAVKAQADSQLRAAIEADAPTAVIETLHEVRYASDGVNSLLWQLFSNIHDLFLGLDGSQRGINACGCFQAVPAIDRAVHRLVFARIAAERMQRITTQP